MRGDIMCIVKGETLNRVSYIGLSTVFVEVDI